MKLKLFDLPQLGEYSIYYQIGDADDDELFLAEWLTDEKR